MEQRVLEVAKDAGARSVSEEAMTALRECVDEATRIVLAVALVDCSDRGGAHLEVRDLETARRMYGALWGEMEKQ